jgi:hypothetical protein
MTPAAEPLDPGPLPELAWLPVAKLSVDERYQRTLKTKPSEKHVERIAANFCWARFGAVLAVKSGDGWLVIDGQHRVEAARERGFLQVPAVVLAAADLAEQASTFVYANRARVPVSAQALFHALVTACDPEALAIATACETAGIKIEKHNKAANQLGAGHTAAAPALLQILRRFGAGVMARAVHTLSHAFGSEPGALRGSFFHAAAAYLAGTSDDVALVAALKRVGWQQLERIGAAAGGGQFSRINAIAAKLREVSVRFQEYPERRSGTAREAPSTGMRDGTAPAAVQTPTAASVGAKPAASPPSRPVVPHGAHRRPIRTAKPAKPQIVTPDQAMIDKFIAERGVTKLPGVGSPEAATIAPLEWDRKKGKFTRGAGA